MNCTKRLLQLFLMCSIAFTATGASAAQSESWSVSDQHEYEVDGTPLALSPDGAWLAGTGAGDEFCIWSVPELDAFCEDATFRALDESIVWAPDSSAVAFANDPARYLVDSDILIFDVESKQLQNLTDDPEEIQEPVFYKKEPGITHADTYPLWSADGETLFFLRGDAGSERRTTEIMSLDVASGEISPHFTISPTEWFTSYAPMFELSDGSLLISIANADIDSPQNGLWRVGPEGNRIDLVLKSGSDGEPRSLRIRDVSADGTTAIVDTQTDLMGGDPSFSPYLTLDLESGETVPFPDPELETSWLAITGDPKFIGEGTDIVFEVAYEDSPEHGIVVSSSVLSTLTDGIDEQYGYGLDVSDDGTILLPGADGNVLVISTELTGDSDKGTPKPPCSCTPPEGN